MKLRPLLSGIVVMMLAALLGACGGNRLLVGEGPDAGSPGAAGTGSSPSGAAGTGSSPTGAAGTSNTMTGEGGSGVTPTGAAGTSNTMTGEGGSGVTPTGAAGAEGGTGAGGSVSVQEHPLQISGAEAITRIAQVLWQEAPDADLMLQAQQGHFKYTSDLYGAVHQMLVDPRAAKGVGAFYRWWLTLDHVASVQKDTTLFPEYTPALQADMVNETQTFGTEVTLNLNGTFQNLFTASESFVNARLAALYGAPGVNGDDLQEVSLPGGERMGLFTQAAVLVQGTLLTANDPSMRGTYIAEKFFCKEIPPPPAGENSFSTPPAGTTVRTALTQAISSDASCTACHAIIDPAGFAFENYDAIGRYRTTDNGAPVDATGLQVTGLFTESMRFDSPYVFAKATSVAPEAERCFARQWHSFVLQTPLGNVSDQLVEASYQAFEQAQFNLKELIVSVLTTDAFLASHLGLQ
jgi:hypothetical protein